VSGERPIIRIAHKSEGEQILKTVPFCHVDSPLVRFQITREDVFSRTRILSSLIILT
jgi:hypothetical protein